MAQRPVWRGHIRLALVTCPVALYAARHERGNLHFHMINPATGHRIHMVAEDAETGDPVDRADLVRGYEYAPGRHLVLTDEDIERARIESSSTLTLDKFVAADQIDPIHYESTYYVVPDGDAGIDVYAVLRDAMAEAGRIALSRVVLSSREHPVAIRPDGRGLVAHTLAEARDLNDPAPLLEGLDRVKPDREMVKLARQLIARQEGRYDPADIEDRYETRLRQVIEARLAGEGLEDAAAEAAPDNVVDLMAALRESLARSGRGSGSAAPRKAAPAKKPAAKSAAKPARKSARAPARAPGRKRA